MTMQRMVALLLLAVTASGEAGVTRVIVENTTVIDKDFGAAGRYEMLTGR
jgi:hypothetical protein